MHEYYSLLWDSHLVCKSDARKQRQAAKAEARRNRNLSLILTVQNEEKSPKIEFLADDVKRVVVSDSIASLEVPKQMREARGGSRFGLQMSWCVRKADRLVAGMNQAT
ncbi:hypothetical protein VDG03_20500 [Xanthomonas campestris pv. raphani]|uniref:hypothetical protein n=1 Tax=Xanthomonas campestris TaxID=339 RepID=UPI002B226393|nr:hypothetical protein [Xanthomonas campestris]MEA9753344.1 hypothetical protein [Xanthomonas campestris pv. raphani]MEA9813602.1 hypothetical protein [Xanthomonas campestris pv. raphani]